MIGTIIAAGAGTAEPAAVESCIRPIEVALEAAFPGWEVRRAFTSPRIAKAAGVDTVEEAVAKVEGRTVIVSTHLLPGAEYGRLLETGLPVSEPLLCREEDLVAMAGILEAVAREEGRAVLAVGHGSAQAGATWSRLRELLPERVRLANLEDSVGEVAKNLPGKSITLLPLMIAAGRHARRDVDGVWRPALEELGFDVRVRMEGLGARAEVQAMFAEKAKKLVG